MNALHPTRRTRKRTATTPRRGERAVEARHNNLSALVPGAPRELRITGDVAALDSLDADELARLARRWGR
ncbi:MAG: hypothetical protein U0269_37870 [Polyangiales bacterium]